MRAVELLHKMLKKYAPSVHAKRANCLVTAVTALLNGKRLTLTGLGRSMEGKCSTRSAIRKVDKLLGNHRLNHERDVYYKMFCHYLLNNIKTPLVSVDWTAAPHHEYYCLRASMNIKGRSIVLYEEVYERKYEKNTKINNDFLKRLKNIMPLDVKPIIVTDAGFRCPWFKQITALGWDYVGRVRNKNSYYDFKLNKWINTYDLYEQATSVATYIGAILFTKSTELKCNMYMYKGKIKGRKNRNRYGKIYQRTESKVQSKSHRDPLVVVTSLCSRKYSAKQVIDLYSRRMEIEEEFRDVKDPRYGFALKYSGSKGVPRLQALLLIAALASFLCWIIALSLRRKGEHFKYQSNTVRHTTVLSIQFLVCEAYRKMREKLTITLNEFKQSLTEMRDYAREAAHA